MTPSSIHPPLVQSDTGYRLKIDDLAMMRGGMSLIEALHLRLDAGQLMFLRGANGSGKTTFLRGLARLIPISGGQFAINGITNTADQSAFMRQIILIGHRNAGFEHLNVTDSLRLMASLMDMEISQQQIIAALDHMGITALAHRQMNQLSAGQQRRVALARLVLAAPQTHRLWLIDEPFNALDDAATSQLCSLITAYCHDGGSAIISGHGHMPLHPDATLTLGTKPQGVVT